MKELSIEENAKAYTELINRLEAVKDAIKKQNYGIAMDILYKPYPEFQITTSTELKESEDERIRKELLCFFKERAKYTEDSTFNSLSSKEIIAWLEKQAEHANFINKIQVGDKVTRNEDGVLVNLSQLNRVAKPAGKVEPKFKVGDWVVYCNEDVDLITGIEENGYCINNGGYIPFVCASDIRLWTVQDAKDGDVLATKDAVFIFKHKDKTGLSLCKSYCEVIGNSKLGFGFDFSINGVYPATKEQRDFLFQKIKEAGYEWDAEKKELKKIEQNPAWCEEDEKQARQIERIISNDGCTKKLQEQIHNWFESLKSRVQPQQEWSEEEVEIIDWLVASFDCLKIPTDTFYQSKVRPFLISLRNKIQPIINEWSEEDEQHIDSLLKRLDGLCRNEFERTRFAISEDRDWLKSLKDRYTWKPSDEQMHYLSWIANIKLGDSVVEQEVSKHLNELLEDLKKLKQ